MNSIFEPSEYVQIIPLNILCTLLPQKVEIGIRNGTVLSRLYENGGGRGPAVGSWWEGSPEPPQAQSWKHRSPQGRSW